jgi:hypothetical protein
MKRKAVFIAIALIILALVLYGILDYSVGELFELSPPN